MALTGEDVQAWLDAYVRAWASYDEQQIGDLFASDASYRYHPWEEPVRGRDAIVADWLESKDPPGSWQASYQPYLISGNRAVVTGTSDYSSGVRFWNIWSLTFDDDGRVSDFNEWFMKQPV
jgi:hypothetical protein